MWRHFLNDFTHWDEKEVRVQCKFCKSGLKSSRRKPILAEAEDVMACIEKQNAAHVGELIPQTVQMRAPPAPGYGSSAMAMDPQAQLLLPVQTCALTAGSGSSAMDVEHAGPGAQLLPPPSAPSCRAGSSSDGIGKPGMDEPSKHIARMIALCGCDPSVVDNEYFRKLLESLNPEFKVPSRVEIEKDCDRISDEARTDLLSRLSSSVGGISLAVRRTKTVDKEFMYVVCHFIDDEWMLRKLVIEIFMDVDKHAHLSPYILGVHMMDFSDGDYYYFRSATDIIIGTIPTHGASNRVSMLTSETKDIYLRNCLEDSIWYKLSSTGTRTREIVHTTYMDKVLHAIAKCFLEVVEELRFDLSVDVQRLNLTREELQQLISHLDLDDPWMYYDEQWYVSYCFMKVFRMESFSATDTNSSGEQLSKVWDRIKQFNRKFCDDDTTKFTCNVWEVIHHAIQKISAPSYPTSHLCLEVLVNMRKFLQSELTRCGTPENGEDVLDYLRDAIKTLDKAIEDSYLIWAIPLALDPQYKFEHICSIFHKAFEPVVATEYYSKVEKMITDLYHDYRKDEVGTSTGAGHSDIGVTVAVSVSAEGDDRDGPMHQRDWPAELKWYICDPAAAEEDFDIVKWWKGNSQRYPTLARMAKDALAMPTCSKPSPDEIAQIRSIDRGYSQLTISPW